MKGKEVICIKDNRTVPIEIMPNWIVKDKIYTIRAIQASIDGNGWGLLLEEVGNPAISIKMGNSIIGKSEPGFNTVRFCTLDGKQLSISLEQEELIKNN